MASSETARTHLPERRKPDTKIKRNLKQRQPTCERNANRIPLELFAMYRCHVRSFDSEYRSQKTGAKPVQVPLIDNGIQFVEQPRSWNIFYSRPMHFDMICEANGIEYRLTKPNHQNLGSRAR